SFLLAIAKNAHLLRHFYFSLLFLFFFILILSHPFRLFGKFNTGQYRYLSCLKLVGLFMSFLSRDKDNIKSKFILQPKHPLDIFFTVGYKIKGLLLFHHLIEGFQRLLIGWCGIAARCRRKILLLLLLGPGIIKELPKPSHQSHRR